jgi:hypothetical protein
MHHQPTLCTQINSKTFAKKKNQIISWTWAWVSDALLTYYHAKTNWDLPTQKKKNYFFSNSNSSLSCISNLFLVPKLAWKSYKTREGFTKVESLTGSRHIIT